MQAIHTHYFLHHLQKIPSFKDAIVFSKENGKWKDLETSNQTNPALLLNLRTSKSSARIQKLPLLGRAIIRLAKGDLAVAIKSPAKTHAKTLEGYARRIDDCFAAATSTFRAHHDELTGALNRHGIQEELQSLHSSFFFSVGLDRWSGKTNNWRPRNCRICSRHR